MILRLLALWVGLSLCLPSAQAVELPWTAVEFFNLTGGLNDGADPTAIAPNEASDLQNVVLNTSGGIEKRSGFSNINGTVLGATATLTGLTFYRQSDGDRFLVGLVSNGATDTIQKMDYAGSSGPDGTWDNVTGSLSLAFADDELADFVTAEDILYAAYGDGTRSLLKWTGTGNASELTSLPDATMAEFHKRILWLAGRSDARSRVDFSNLDEPETFTSTDFLLVETDDGQNITGLKSALDCLYVFKTESIWRICGADRDNLYLEQMVRGIGAAGNQSIALINNQFLFMTSQGDVALYDGGLTVQILSAKIEGTLSGMNMDRFDDAVGLAFDDGTGDEDYYLALSASGSSTNNRLLVFDTRWKAWTKFTGLAVNAMTSYEIGTSQRAIAFADYLGQANRYPTTDADDGAAIDAYYQSGHLQLGVPQLKVFRDTQVILRQEGTTYNVTFEYRIDFEGAGTSTSLSLAGTGALWDTAVWDAASYADIATSTRRIEVNKEGDFFLWRIANANASQPFLLRGVRVWVEPTGRISGD